MKRILSLFIAIIILTSSAALFSSCSDDKKNLQVVGTVGEYEVYYEELRWLTMQFKDRLEDGFMDNTPRDFAKDAVEWAKTNGILRGDASGNLHLSRPVTREELMVFMHRFSKHISEHMSKL